MSDLPTISIVMPVLNEEHRLPRALRSLSRQDYPKDRLEVIVADAGSRDASLKVVSSFSDQLRLQVVDNSELKQAEAGKTMALSNASGDLVLFFDADEWLVSSLGLRRMATPLLEDASLSGSVAAYHYSEELPLWGRFLSCDEFQRDPLCQVLTPNIEDFVIERRSGYDVCQFRTVRIPPIGGSTMYRAESIDPIRWAGRFREVDHPVHLIKQGLDRFAYVRDAGLAHDHCGSLREMVRKRTRNLLTQDSSFLRYQGERDYIWVDMQNRSEVARLVRWIIGTNLFVPRLLEGVLSATRLRRWELLLRPVAAIAVADTLIATVLGSSEGRRFLRLSIRQLLSS